MTIDVGPQPLKIILHKKSRTLEVIFDNKKHYILPCEYVRAFSPSAEMQHTGQKTAAEFKNVNILAIEPVGHYAIRPIFSDGHRSGIYSWQTLYELGQNLACEGEK